MKKLIFLFYILVLLGNSASLWAQSEPEENKVASSDFQDSFYESLLQKGIENYDKAVVSLEKCLKLEPNNATIYHELGKNYLGSKDYTNAYSSFEKASKIDPKNKWFWVGMYDVCYQTQNYSQGINIINKLIEFDPKFKEDLVSLYMSTSQFDKALDLINELNDKVGKSEKRNAYKLQIIASGKYQNIEIINLISQIEKNPKEQANYISLISLYSKNNEVEKALETTKKMEATFPNSDWAQITLFKTYLDKNEGEKAISAMNIVLESYKIDSKIKHRILNEFLIYANKNPQYLADLEKAVTYFDNDKEVNVAKEIGKFYYNKKQWENASKYLVKSLKNNATDDIEVNILLLQSYTETKQFDLVAKKAEAIIEILPTQPQFYYYAGLGNNQQKNFKKAKDYLEMGLDYLVNDKTLETNFNIQLGEAYSGLGDIKKKELYFSKANQLLKK